MCSLKVITLWDTYSSSLKGRKELNLRMSSNSKGTTWKKLANSDILDFSLHHFVQTPKYYSYFIIPATLLSSECSYVSTINSYYVLQVSVSPQLGPQRHRELYSIYMKVYVLRRPCSFYDRYPLCGSLLLMRPKRIVYENLRAYVVYILRTLPTLVCTITQSQLIAR